MTERAAKEGQTGHTCSAPSVGPANPSKPVQAAPAPEASRSPGRLVLTPSGPCFGPELACSCLPQSPHTGTEARRNRLCLLLVTENRTRGAPSCGPAAGDGGGRGEGAFREGSPTRQHARAAGCDPRGPPAVGYTPGRDRDPKELENASVLEAAGVRRLRGPGVSPRGRGEGARRGHLGGPVGRGPVPLAVPRRPLLCGVQQPRLRLHPAGPPRLWQSSGDPA